MHLEDKLKEIYLKSKVRWLVTEVNECDKFTQGTAILNVWNYFAVSQSS